ncbi:hypothetical protein GCM10022268_02130 [Sphingomonas cynarae]|uniref:Uncharacterized protein n=1 Tax=Sphingomonas cynarae TaxID=930197 RepID=A0ABP7CTB0_9SPHN
MPAQADRDSEATSPSAIATGAAKRRGMGVDPAGKWRSTPLQGPVRPRKQRAGDAGVIRRCRSGPGTGAVSGAVCLMQQVGQIGTGLMAAADRIMLADVRGEGSVRTGREW